MSTNELTASELYEELRRRRVELWCQGKMLRFRAPDNALDPEMMTLLRRHKKALIAILQTDDAPSMDDSRVELTTIGQQALYFLHLSAPYSTAYNVASACRVCSPIEAEAVRTAIELLVQRHESLRTTLEMHSGQLKRRIHRESELDFSSIDVSTFGDDEIAELVRSHYEQPFDLESGPLLRVRWLRRDDDDQILLIVLHHIVFDAWSLWILQDELFQILAQVNGGEIAKLQSSATTFSDFVTHQNQWIESSDGQQDWDYWADELAKIPATLHLQTDLRRPARPEFRGATYRFRLSTELSARLKGLAKSLRLTPFTLTMSIFKVLLFRLTGQDDFVVGTTTSGRSHPKFNSVVGYFVNSLSIRTDASDDPLFTQYAGQVKSKVLGALKHQGYPFAAIVDRLGRQRRVGGNPIFNVMFGLQKPQFGEAATLINDESAEVELAGLRVRPYEMNQQEGQCDLTLELFETEDSFVGSLKYDTDLFLETSAQRLSQQFIALAEEVVANPNRRLSQYELVSAEQRDELLRLSRAATQPEWDGTLLHQWVAFHAVAKPDQVAWVCENEEQTYGQLNHAGDRVARHLIHRGLKPGGLVACCFDRCFETASVMLGIMKAGGVFVPIDHDAPRSRIEALIDSCGAGMMVTDQPIWTRHFEETDTEVVTLNVLSDLIDVVDRPDRQHPVCESEKSVVLEDRVTANSPAYILHTSGSTGTPKGVCVSHGVLARHLVSMVDEYQMTPDDRVLQFSSICFDPSIEQIGTTWHVGGMVVSRGRELWSPEMLWATVAKYDLTIVNLPPTYFQLCQPHAEDDDLASLRLLILGGDVFPTVDMKDWNRRGVRVLNAYGPTEAVITATTYELKRFGAERVTPIGRPRGHSRAYILDHQGRLSPPGTAGRLFLAGPILADGYYSDSALTKSKFIDDPFANEIDSKVGGDPVEIACRMYDTGDIARWNVDGDLEFLGRVDQQVKLDGIRADTTEVEAAIQAIDGIARCCVRLHGGNPLLVDPFNTPIADTSSSQHANSTELIAWIEPSEPPPQYGGREDSDEAMETKVINHLRAVLPRYLIPRRVIVVPSMPLTASGKIAYRDLPQPTKAVRRGIQGYVAPTNEWQTLLATIWSDELGISPVGIHDNFFDLGGASLTSLRIITRANDAGLNPTDVPLNPELLFEHQSIAELYQHLGAPELTPCEQT